MVAISGISKKKFMRATQDALSQLKGSSVKLGQLRQFVATQFHLHNEHLIEGMFAPAAPDTPQETLGQIEIDIGARGILFNQLQYMFVYRNADGYIGGHWPGNPLCSDDDLFVPLSGVEWWQESAFIFPSREACLRSLPAYIADDPQYQIVEVREIPGLHMALCDAITFSTQAPSDAERSVGTLTHLFGATREAYKDDASHGCKHSSYAMYVYNAFRYMLTRMLPASDYPNVDHSLNLATLYTPEMGFGENVSKLSLQQRIALWATYGDHGASSRFLFAHMSGLASTGLCATAGTARNTPYDAQALRCCAQMLECIPEWKPRMQEIAQYGDWEPYIREWDALTSLLMHESNLTDIPLYDQSARGVQSALQKIMREKVMARTT